MLRLKLATHAPTRQKLMTLLRERRGALLSTQDEEELARYTALLEVCKQEAWGDQWGKKSDEGELPFEQMMTIRVVKAELESVGETPLVRRLGQDRFGETVGRLIQDREHLGKLRPDGRRSI